MFVSQILNEDIIKKTCEDSQLCIIAVLPHILDTGETTQTSERSHNKRWTWTLSLRENLYYSIVNQKQ